MKKILSSDRILLLAIAFCLFCLYYYSFNNFSDAIGYDDTIRFAENIGNNYSALNFMNFRETFSTTLTWSITSLLNFLGVKGWGAINSLRFFTAVSGSAGIIIFILLLQKIKVDRTVQFIFPLILAVSLSYWFNSANGESCIPGLTAALATIYYTLLLLTKPNPPAKFISLGLISAFAIGFRIDNVLLMPLIILIICLFPTTKDRYKARYCINYIGATVAFSILGYIGFYLTLTSWQRMSSDIFYISQPCNLSKYAIAICATISALPKALINSSAGGFCIVTSLLFLLSYALLKYRLLRKELQSVTIICLAWLGLFLLTYSWGSCDEPEFRAFYNYVPILIICGIGCTYLVNKKKMVRLTLGTFFGAIFLIIFYANLQYIFEARKSTYFQCLKCITASADKNSVILVSNPDMARIGKYYFAEENKIILIRKAERNFVEKFVNAINRHRAVKTFVVLEEPQETFLSKGPERSCRLHPKLSMVLLDECSNKSLFVYLVL